jgi:hypothetical protein
LVRGSPRQRPYLYLKSARASTPQVGANHKDRHCRRRAPAEVEARLR